MRLVKTVIDQSMTLFEHPCEKCHWPVNDSFEAPILLELMAMCHWLQSMTQNLWTFVIDCSQWQKFMAKLAKKCHWLWSMTKKSVIDWMYTIWGQNILWLKDENTSQKPLMVISSSNWISNIFIASKSDLNYSLKTLTKVQLQRLILRLSDVRDGKGREKDGSYLSMKD